MMRTRGWVLMLLLAGCTSDPVTGEITVLLTPGRSSNNYSMFVSNADGDVLSTPELAAETHAVIEAGGMVTIVEVSLVDGPPQMASVAGVMPGDVLHFDWREFDSFSNRIELELPATAIASGAAVSIDDGCGVATASIGATLAYLEREPRCTTAPTAALSYAFDLLSNRLAYSVDPSIDPAVSTIGGAAIAFDTWRTDFTSQTIEVVNAPADALFMELEYSLLRDGFAFDEQRGQGGVSEDVVFHAPAQFAQNVLVRVEVLGGGTAGVIGQFAQEANTTVDLSTILPWTTGLEAEEEGPLQYSLSWSTAGDMASADWARISVHFGGHTTWSILAPPHGETELVLPELPMDRWIDGAPEAASFFSLTYVDDSEYAGWQDVKNRAAFPNRVAPATEARTVRYSVDTFSFE